MDESLEKWITVTCQDNLHLYSHDSDDDTEINLSLPEIIVLFGKYLLSNHEISQVDDVRNGLLQILQIKYFEEENIYSVIKLLLKFVVSPYCNERENFVSQILALTPDIQEHLMEAIQSQALEDVDDAEDIAHDEIEERPIKSTSSQWKNSSENAYCDNCPRLRQELDKYHKEMTSFVQRERQLEDHYKSENTLQINKIMDLESLLVEKSIEMKQLTIELNILKKKELDYDKELKEKTSMSFKILELQDQVDSLIQMTKRADVAEKQVEKLREKLDRLSGVSEQLKAEISAHNETHVMLLQYEQELNTLRTTKQHLEEYRKRCVENEIEINDQKIQLKKSDEKITTLLSQLQDLTEGNKDASNQTKILTAELLHASEEIRNHERGVGVGLGISEFNPEIKKELQTLRAENEELKQQINDTSMTSLDLLRQQISDQQCFNTSLQEKWNYSKDVIKNLQETLTETSLQLDYLRHSYEVLQREAQESAGLAHEELLSTKTHFKNYEKNFKKTFLTKLSLMFVGQRCVQEEFKKEISHLSDTLEITTANYQEMTDRCVASEQLNQAHKVTIQQLTDQYTSLDHEHQKKFQDFQHETENNYQRYFQEYSEKIELLRQEHGHEMVNEKRRYTSLEVEMESERGKRRKVEREKKIYENEALKYRNQYELLSSGNMNSSEMNVKEMTAIIREMKIMQDQLDNSREEVKRLQDQLSFIQSSSSTSSSASAAASSSSSSSAAPAPFHNNSVANTGLSSTHATEENDNENNDTNTVVSQGIHSGPSRQVQRVRLQSTHTLLPTNTSSTLPSTTFLRSNTATTADLSAYIEQTELLERKIEQMNRERRELIAKNIEENKEKVELNQRLLQHEREFTALKGKFVKLELEKERLERRIAKNGPENAPPAPGPSMRSRQVLGTL